MTLLKEPCKVLAKASVEAGRHTQFRGGDAPFLAVPSEPCAPFRLGRLPRATQERSL